MQPSFRNFFRDRFTVICIEDLDAGQRAIGDRVDSNDLAGAEKLQKELDVKMFAAENSRWKDDRTILFSLLS